MNSADKFLTMVHITYLKYVEQFPDVAKLAAGRDDLINSALADTEKLFNQVKEVNLNGK